jgi:phospholipase/carboxylesterase
MALAVVALGVLLYLRVSPRSASLPLATYVDGPAPTQAAGVLVFLHGRGGGIGRAKSVVEQLRKAGLPSDVAIVLVEAPFWYGFGHGWGSTADEQATSRQRLRARLRELLGKSTVPPARVIIAGFSQGAGVAIDTAIEEPRIGALASFSPCFSWLRDKLPARDGLRILLAHGSADKTCPVNESRTLARVLEQAHKPVRYIEFSGGHTVPPVVIDALAAFAIAP